MTIKKVFCKLVGREVVIVNDVLVVHCVLQQTCHAQARNCVFCERNGEFPLEKARIQRSVTRIKADGGTLGLVDCGVPRIDSNLAKNPIYQSAIRELEELLRERQMPPPSEPNGQ